ncbi:MAG: LacI family DNA-binding transcriptional regulator [Pseudomonadota bacterium]
MTKPTIDDVAYLAGVSIKTVSRVVNREPNVRDVTRRRVESAIVQLNYRPNISARNLASHRSHLVVLIYDDPGTGETPDGGTIVRLQQGALRACHQAGCELLIHPCDVRDKRARPTLQALIERTRPDGVVIAAPLSNIATVIRPFADAEVPYVRLSPGTKSVSEYAVGTDDRAVAAKMTQYLANLGHQEIAFISGHDQHRAVVNRLRGYRDGLANAGIAYRETRVVAGDNTIRSGAAAAERLLARKKIPTAIFAANDEMAVGVIQAANRLGIVVPKQLSVAGFDDSTLARFSSPSLTTVRQPLAQMAECAVAALFADSDGQRPPPGINVIPATLKIRDSTGPVPTVN